MNKYLIAPSEDVVKILEAFGIDAEKCIRVNINFEVGEIVTIRAEFYAKLTDEKELITVLKKYRLERIED